MPAPTANLPIVGDTVSAEARDAGLNAALEANHNNTEAHKARTDNPHGTTKAQVGLGDVDNTSDANKPVSTAQASALAAKADKETTITASGLAAGGGALDESREINVPAATPAEAVAGEIDNKAMTPASDRAALDAFQRPYRLINDLPVRDTGPCRRVPLKDQNNKVLASFGALGHLETPGIYLKTRPVRDFGPDRSLVTIDTKKVVTIGGDGSLWFKASPRLLSDLSATLTAYYVTPADAIAALGGWNARLTQTGYVYSTSDFDGQSFDVQTLTTSDAPTGVALGTTSMIEIVAVMGQSNAGKAGGGLEIAAPLYPHHVIRLDYPNPALSSGTTSFTLDDIIPADDSVTNSETVGHLPATMGGTALEWHRRRGGKPSSGIATLTSLKGGSPITDFVPGQNVYENVKTGVAAWQDILETYGRTVTVPAIHFVQGETLGANYLDNLTLIAETLPGELQAITGQPTAPVFAMMQTQNAANVSQAALLQVAAARAVSGAIMSGPLYSMPLKQGDNIHLDPIGRLMQGELIAYVNDTVTAGGTWLPVWWTSITYDGAAQIDLTYAVPSGLSLSIDDDWVPDTPNHGFHLFSADNGVTISSVTITGANTVRIILSGTPTGAPRLGYARGDGTGNDYIDGSYSRSDPVDPSRTINRTFAEGYMRWRGNLMVETARPSAFYALGKFVPPYVRIYAVADEWTLATGTHSI